MMVVLWQKTILLQKNPCVVGEVKTNFLQL